MNKCPECKSEIDDGSRYEVDSVCVCRPCYYKLTYRADILRIPVANGELAWRNPAPDWVRGTIKQPTKGEQYIGKIATAKTAPGELYGTGEVISYCDAPQVTIRRADGSAFDWRVDLCEFVEKPEPVPVDALNLLERWSEMDTVTRQVTWRELTLRLREGTLR